MYRHTLEYAAETIDWGIPSQQLGCSITLGMGSTVQGYSQASPKQRGSHQTWQAEIHPPIEIPDEYGQNH